MSDLIKKLAEQATTRVDAIPNESMAYTYFDTEKFAELLIKEVHYVIFVGGVENLDIVLEHFGVEE